MNPKQLMTFALDLGELMLRSGAETYRVEDTITRILKTSHYDGIEAFVTPTGLFVTMDHPDLDHLTYIRRITERHIHLAKIEEANTISREFCHGHTTLEDAQKALLTLEKLETYQPLTMVLAIGLATGFFAIVLAGSFADAFVAFLAGIILALFQQLVKRKGISKFLLDIMGGLISGYLTLLLYYQFHLGDNLDLMIISSIMPLVPGVAITNAVRDTIHGDLVSGSARILEAFIIAASIATGVGIAFYLYQSTIGGITL